MKYSKGFGCAFALALVVNLGGCKSPSEVQVDGINAKDPTMGAINGLERRHAWIVAGVPGQSIRFDISVRNSQNKTDVPLELDSVSLVGTNDFFPMQQFADNALKQYQKSTLILNYGAVALPALDSEKKRVIPYSVQAEYGAETITSDPAFVEVLRPYCQVDAAPFSTLGMTFETPAGVAPEGGWPTLLFVHGGGLNRRNHVDMEAYAMFMLEQGYAVANMNYRLVDTENNQNNSIYAKADLWNDPVSDVKCAIRYLKENSAVLKVNAGKIGMVGHSSGANIAMEAAMTFDSSLPVFAEQGTPVRLGPVTQSYDTSVAALFTMDAIVNFSVFWELFEDSALALVAANSPLLNDAQKVALKDTVTKTFVAEQTIINGFGPNDLNWENHPSAVAQDVVNYIDLQTDLPVFMEHSTVNPKKEFWGIKLKAAPYEAWRSSCTFVNAVQNAGSSKQQGQTFAKDVVGGTHYDFVENPKTVTNISNDMLGFFNFYLKNQGTKPVTGFDYSRCDSLGAG